VSERRLASAAVAELDAERGLTLDTLLDLSDADVRTGLEWYGRTQSVGHMLRSFTSHSLDHFQHLHRLLQDRHRKLTEANLLLMKAQAVQAEFTTMVRCLSDSEFMQTGPADGDWSAAQILEHVLTTERSYRSAITQALGRTTNLPPADTEPGASVVVEFGTGGGDAAVKLAGAAFTAFGRRLASVHLVAAHSPGLAVKVDGSAVWSTADLASDVPVAAVLELLEARLAESPRMLTGAG
jgi:hypothetical protein